MGTRSRGEDFCVNKPRNLLIGGWSTSSTSSSRLSAFKKCLLENGVERPLGHPGAPCRGNIKTSSMCWQPVTGTALTFTVFPKVKNNHFSWYRDCLPGKCHSACFLREFLQFLSLLLCYKIAFLFKTVVLRHLHYKLPLW